MKDIEKLLKEVMNEKLATAQAGLAQNTPPGVEVPDLAAEFEKSLKARAENPTPPSPPDIDEMLQRMPEEFRAKIPEEKLAELRKLTADSKPKLEALMKQAEELKAQMPDGELDLGQYHPFLKKMTREKVAELHAAGASMQGYNFTDLDLSDMDLSGGLFNEAHFVRTNLKGSRLMGARFEKARFDAVDASGADFSGANLENSLWLHESQAQQASFVKAHAKSIKILKCQFAKTNFDEAELESAFFNESMLDESSFRSASMKSLVLIKTQARNCDLTGATWSKTFINQGSIAGSCLENSQAKHVVIWSSDARSLKARGAHLPGFIVGGEETALDGSCFDEADLSRTSQMNISAQGISARNTIFDQGILQKVDLSGTDLYGARGVKARITKCKLENVNLGGINLMQGSLRKSQIKKSDLSAGCFYSTEFYQAKFVETRLDAAFTELSSLNARQRLDASRRAE